MRVVIARLEIHRSNGYSNEAHIEQRQLLAQMSNTSHRHEHHIFIQQSDQAPKINSKVDIRGTIIHRWLLHQRRELAMEEADAAPRVCKLRRTNSTYCSLLTVAEKAARGLRYKVLGIPWRVP